jgi:hypothetical protein
MRLAPLILLVFSLVATSCGPSDAYGYNKTTPFILLPGKVERKFTCNIVLDDDFVRHGEYAAVRVARRVPESALTQERWWGDGPKPKVVSLAVGDCISLDFAYFCVEEISPGKSVTFRKMYIPEYDTDTVIKRLPRRR